MSGSIRMLATALAISSLTACGSSSTTPSPPPDLTGTWSGQLGQPGSTSALRLTWVATHTGNTVSGVATLIKPAVNVPARGAMTGTLQGDRLALTYVVFPDTIPGFATCEIAGLGNGTVTSNRIAGVLPLMFRGCAGTGLEPPGTNDMVFTR
jgi:hypothetical protein